jgi:LuxR family quorum-sensing system transcriptional regulator SolR
MMPPLEELARELASAKCEQALFIATTRFAAKLGFEYCAYCMRLPLPTSNPTVVLFSNHPPAWQSEYLRKNYLAIDPTFRHAMHSQAPLVWSDKVFAETSELWNRARAHGLKVGWAQPCRDARNVIGLLTLARSGREIDDAEASQKQFHLAWLAQTTHIGMTKYLARRLVPAMDAKLSAREIDVLRWAAEGKTAGEIADILRITHRTVYFHVNNAVTKLGVTNKTTAAIHAVILGLL